MGSYAHSVEVLIDELGRLPGIGPKSAQRIAFHLLKVEKADSVRLADALIAMKDKATFCERCFNIAEDENVADNYEVDATEGRVSDDVLAAKDVIDVRRGVECQICLDTSRDSQLICVVEEPKDVSAIEKTGVYSGLYHVLLGNINPLEGIGPDQLKIKELAHRVAAEDIKEVILSTNPNLEGDTTAAFIASKILAPFGVKVTRLASGLPVGGDLEYADELTLGKALQGRLESYQP